MNLQELIVKHDLNDSPPEFMNKVKELCKEVVQTGWFAGTNHAHDVADGVFNEHPDRKQFLKHFLGQKQ